MATIESIKHEMEILDSIKDTISDGEYLEKANALMAKWNELASLNKKPVMLIIYLLFDESDSDGGVNDE